MGLSQILLQEFLPTFLRHSILICFKSFSCSLYIPPSGISFKGFLGMLSEFVVRFLTEILPKQIQNSGNFAKFLQTFFQRFLSKYSLRGFDTFQNFHNISSRDFSQMFFQDVLVFLWISFEVTLQIFPIVLSETSRQISSAFLSIYFRELYYLGVIAYILTTTLGKIPARTPGATIIGIPKRTSRTPG